MACRIDVGKFERMTDRAARQVGLYRFTVSDDAAPEPMVEVDGTCAVLHRKPIQALVDTPRQAKPIIRNLLRWAKEHGAR